MADQEDAYPRGMMICFKIFVVVFPATLLSHVIPTHGHTGYALSLLSDAPYTASFLQERDSFLPL
jgi:hypothetical protein